MGLLKDSFEMVLFEIFMIASLLSSASAYNCNDLHKGPCKKTSRCEPKVTPKNTTHLLVNWENVLEKGCEQKYILDIKIVVIEEGFNSRFQNTKRVPANMKSTTVEADPCKSHLVVVKFDFTLDYIKNHGRSRAESPNTEYNKIVENEFPDPFGGLLTTEVLPKVCFKTNGTIHIPKAPAAVAKCDVQSGDVEDPDFQEEGTTGNVKITFKNPVEPDQKTYTMFEVKDIKACSGSKTNNSINKNNLIIGLAVGFALLLFALFILAFVACWKRQKQTKSKNTKKEVDVNPVYGIYALDEEGEDISVTEVRDTNDYYFK